MSRRRSLEGRLIATYVAVVVAVIVAASVTIWLLTPRFFHQRIQAREGGGPGRGGGSGGVALPPQVEDSYNEALTIALVVAAIVGIVLAVVLAAWMTRRLLHGLAELGEGTRRLAAGDYQRPVGEPAEAELAALAEAINTLGADLAATERTRAELVSNLAHELRNPLATIEGYMEGLIDGVLPATTDTYGTVAAEAHRLKRLTDDLSLLSRAQEGALDLDLQPIDLADLARAVAERLRPQFDAQEVRLEVHLDQPLEVVADPDRIAQAITNLVGNALGHTPVGGTVTLAGDRADGACRISIADTGAGIPPDQLDAIFDRFTRLHDERTGSGLGLNIARTVAHLHGGDITAHSDGPGTGATFVLTLPGSRPVRS